MLVMFLCIPATFGFLLYGIKSGDHRWLLYSAGAVAVGLFSGIVNYLMSLRLRCPLCMVPPLHNRRCSKHRSVRKVLGSHRLATALSILFKDCFRCPYCGEPTVMEIRQRGRR